MHELVYLRDLVVILGFGVIIVTLFNKFKLPAIAGFIFSGMLVGPDGLGLVGDVHQVEVLAEIGVALLLFGIGLELSLAKLQRLWKLILTGGFLQVSLSIAAVYVIAKAFDLPGNTAIFIGFIVALSSTAIVLRGLQQRNEVDAPHGRLTLGILVFQDLCVVPMILALPILSGSDVPIRDLLGTLLQSIVIIVGVLIAARLIVPRILNFVARTRQRQLFILSIFLICIGTAWLITTSGASLAIGAFLAGLVVSGSEYRHQALADMISFREVFASLFFVSVGMLLSPLVFIDNIVLILILLVVLIIGKALIVFISALILRMPLRVCLLAALALAQIGEFALVLTFAAQGTGLIEKSLESSILSAAILSMFITPFAMAFGPKLAAGIGKLRGLTHLLDVATAEDATDIVKTMQDHVIIGGYGFAGRELAMALKRCNIPFVIVDLNVENVRRACQEVGNTYFGDITSQEVLEKLGIESARELVLLINDPSATERTVKLARIIAPKLTIIARTNYLLDVKPMLAKGADEVIPAEREAAAMITSRILERHQIDNSLIDSHCTQIRSQTEEKGV